MPAKKKTARRKAATRKKKAGSPKAPSKPANEFVILLDGSDDASSSADAIKLEASHTIANVADLHAQLTAALESGDPVSVDAGDVAQVDAAALQLLCSFARDAAARKIDVCWQSQSQVIADAARSLGLKNELSLD